MSRQDKVANELRHQISQIIHDEVKDPRVGFVTVTRVKVTVDLQMARVYYTVLGDETQRKNSEEGLKCAAGFIKKELAARMRMRYMPVLEFSLDQTQDVQQRIDEVLKKIDDDKRKANQ